MLSVEDYKRFEKCANVAYQAGMLEESNTCSPNMTEKASPCSGQNT